MKKIFDLLFKRNKKVKETTDNKVDKNKKEKYDWLDLFDINFKFVNPELIRVSVGQVCNTLLNSPFSESDLVVIKTLLSNIISDIDIEVGVPSIAGIGSLAIGYYCKKTNTVSKINLIYFTRNDGVIIYKNDDSYKNKLLNKELEIYWEFYLKTLENAGFDKEVVELAVDAAIHDNNFISTYFNNLEDNFKDLLKDTKELLEKVEKLKEIKNCDYTYEKLLDYVYSHNEKFKQIYDDRKALLSIYDKNNIHVLDFANSKIKSDDLSNCCTVTVEDLTQWDPSSTDNDESDDEPINDGPIGLLDRLTNPVYSFNRGTPNNSKIIKIRYTGGINDLTSIDTLSDKIVPTINSLFAFPVSLVSKDLNNISKAIDKYTNNIKFDRYMNETIDGNDFGTLFQCNYTIFCSLFIDNSLMDSIAIYLTEDDDWVVINSFKLINDNKLYRESFCHNIIRHNYKECKNKFILNITSKNGASEFDISDFSFMFETCNDYLFRFTSGVFALNSISAAMKKCLKHHSFDMLSFIKNPDINYNKIFKFNKYKLIDLFDSFCDSYDNKILNKKIVSDIKQITSCIQHIREDINEIDNYLDFNDIVDGIDQNNTIVISMSIGKYYYIYDKTNDIVYEYALLSLPTNSFPYSIEIDDKVNDSNYMYYFNEFDITPYQIAKELNSICDYLLTQCK